MAENPNGLSPAFPIPGHPAVEALQENVFKSERFPGCTKRELFAAMALQGMLAGRETYPGTAEKRATLARACVECADALLAALKSEGAEPR